MDSQLHLKKQYDSNSTKATSVKRGTIMVYVEELALNKLLLRNSHFLLSDWSQDVTGQNENVMYAVPQDLKALNWTLHWLRLRDSLLQSYISL